jgi:hypothetical protein
VSIKLSKHSCASSAWQGRRRQLTNVSKLSDSKEMMSLGSRKPSLLDVNLARNWLFCDALRPIISSSKRLSVLRYRHCYTLKSRGTVQLVHALATGVRAKCQSHERANNREPTRLQQGRRNVLDNMVPACIPQNGLHGRGQAGECFGAV